MARALAAPLGAVADAVHALAGKGGYHERVPVSGSGEIGQIGEGVNRLLDQMQAREREFSRDGVRLSLALGASQLSLWDWDIPGEHWISWNRFLA